MMDDRFRFFASTLVMIVFFMSAGSVWNQLQYLSGLKFLIGYLFGFALCVWAIVYLFELISISYRQGIIEGESR